MIDRGKHNVLGVHVDAVDYEAAVAKIIEAAEAGTRFSCSALAVHGVMTGALDAEQRFRLNAFDLVTPDGQPVRWGLNALYGTDLADRVYGPTLMLKICETAAAAGLSIYLHGATLEVVAKLTENLEARYPGLKVAGATPSAFRQLTRAERRGALARIRNSGAAITFVGLGCPRQEVFAYETADELGMPVIAVGAAFDYHAGVKSEPPELIQRMGLQWLHRLIQDPRRLWKRYLVTNTLFVVLLAGQRLRLWRPSTIGRPPRSELNYG